MKPICMTTDVLIVGGAGAGLRAAIEAAREGATVLLVSKSRAAGESSTLRTEGWFTYCPPEHADELFRHVVTLGGFLNNQRLVEIYATQTHQRVKELEEFGVKFEASRCPFAARSGFPSGIRIVGARPRGRAMTMPMRKEAERLGVTIIDGTIVSDLIVADGRFLGAVLFNLPDKSQCVVAAKSCVIATGGGAGMFERQNNPPGTTGDGFALALRAGAELVDIELISFTYPQHGVEMILSLGDRKNERLFTLGGAHYFLGGIRIDERTRTTVKGLFAAGEVTGGVFGAARHSGAAMADIVVFGAIAGKEAAKFAKAQHSHAVGDIPFAEPLAFLQKLQSNTGSPPRPLIQKLLRLMWRNVGPVKNEESLITAAELLEDMREDVRNMRASTPVQVKRAIELRNMFDTAQVIVAASRIRKESRGNFWRTDFPQPDNDNWLRNIFVSRREGEIRTRMREPVMTKLRTPTQPHIGAGCFSYEYSE